MYSALQSATALVFDCDGVVLNSNSLKTEAFRLIATPYGEAAAEALVQYHLAHGGVSRYKKFEYLFTTILRRPCNRREVDALASEYSIQVRNAVLNCEVTQGLDRLREATSQCPWMMVSGGDETELRWILKERGLDKFFDKGIFGSPASKDEIFQQQIFAGRLDTKSIYIGDSRYDHQAASRANVAFIFASDWTEFGDWRSYCGAYKVPVIAKVGDLIKNQ